MPFLFSRKPRSTFPAPSLSQLAVTLMRQLNCHYLRWSWSDSWGSCGALWATRCLCNCFYANALSIGSSFVRCPLCVSGLPSLHSLLQSSGPIVRNGTRNNKSIKCIHLKWKGLQIESRAQATKVAPVLFFIFMTLNLNWPNNNNNNNRNINCALSKKKFHQNERNRSSNTHIDDLTGHSIHSNDLWISVNRLRDKVIGDYDLFLAGNTKCLS